MVQDLNKGVYSSPKMGGCIEGDVERGKRHHNHRKDERRGESSFRYPLTLSSSIKERQSRSAEKILREVRRRKPKYRALGKYELLSKSGVEGGVRPKVRSISDGRRGSPKKEKKRRGRGSGNTQP